MERLPLPKLSLDWKGFDVAFSIHFQFQFRQRTQRGRNDCDEKAIAVKMRSTENDNLFAPSPRVWDERRIWIFINVFVYTRSRRASQSVFVLIWKLFASTDAADFCWSSMLERWRVNPLGFIPNLSPFFHYYLNFQND